MIAQVQSNYYSTAVAAGVDERPVSTAVAAAAKYPAPPASAVVCCTSACPHGSAKAPHPEGGHWIGVANLTYTGRNLGMMWACMKGCSIMAAADRRDVGGQTSSPDMTSLAAAEMGAGGGPHTRRFG